MDCRNVALVGVDKLTCWAFALVVVLITSWGWDVQQPGRHLALLGGGNDPAGTPQASTCARGHCHLNPVEM